MLFRYDVRWIACGKKKPTAYELQVARIGDTAEQHVDLTHRENAFQATSDDVLNGERLRFMHGQSVTRYQRQLHQYGLTLARRQSLLPRGNVDVVEI